MHNDIFILENTNRTKEATERAIKELNKLIEVEYKYCNEQIKKEKERTQEYRKQIGELDFWQNMINYISNEDTRLHPEFFFPTSLQSQIRDSVLIHREKYYKEKTKQHDPKYDAEHDYIIGFLRGHKKLKNQFPQFQVPLTKEEKEQIRIRIQKINAGIEKTTYEQLINEHENIGVPHKNIDKIHLDIQIEEMLTNAHVRGDFDDLIAYMSNWQGILCDSIREYDEIMKEKNKKDISAREIDSLIVEKMKEKVNRSKSLVPEEKTILYEEINILSKDINKRYTQKEQTTESKKEEPIEGKITEEIVEEKSAEEKEEKLAEEKEEKITEEKEHQKEEQETTITQ